MCKIGFHLSALPVDVPAHHVEQRLLALQGTELEALDQEEILKFDLFVCLFKMFHKHSNHHIYKDKLGQEDENNKEERSDILVYTTITQAVIAIIALLSQRIFHNPIPVIS